MTTKPHVLITGAAGLVGGIYASHWGDRYALRLADIQPISDLAGHEESVALDIRDLKLSPRRVETQTSSHIWPLTAARAPTFTRRLST